MTKTGQLFYVKWIDINNQGSTWEPASHLVGEKAEALLELYLKMRANEKEAAEKKKADALAGLLVETGKSGDAGGSSSTRERDLDRELKRKRERTNESIVWDHFGSWYWDNSVVPAAKRAECKLCNKVISASSTTNLRTHLAAAHKHILLEEIRADETLEVGQQPTLKSLRKDFGAVEKFKGEFKNSLDEAFVKWCCKKRRPLSMGETDKELKSFLLQATRGRYSPPTRKTTMDILMVMRVRSENTTKKDMKALKAERVAPSISGTFAFVHAIVLLLATGFIVALSLIYLMLLPPQSLSSNRVVLAMYNRGYNPFSCKLNNLQLMTSVSH